MRTFFCVLVLLSSLEAHATLKVRRVNADRDQIVIVHTALGIATIVQVPDRPNSVVIGDAEAFKVEYLDQAITVKPLHRGAKSNLYIYTDYQRFNVELTNGVQGAADYVVYLEAFEKLPSKSKSSLVWTSITKRLANGSLTLTIKRVGRTHEGLLLCEFSIESTTRETIKADWIWLTQASVVRPIHSLFLSALKVEPGAPVSGLIQIRQSDIDASRPLRLELRRGKTTFLTIPKVNSWK